MSELTESAKSELAMAARIIQDREFASLAEVALIVQSAEAQAAIATAEALERIADRVCGMLG